MIIRHAIAVLLIGLVGPSLGIQPSAVAPIPAPLRELPWAQLNFLHTTDTHGWHAGHLLEPSYSADWGDYISFASRLRDKADIEGVDLLLIDTGDRIEGNGLYDASRPKGKYDLEIFAQQDIDLLCSGNHELYKHASIDFEFNTTVARFRDSYLASNLDVIDPKDGTQKPLAQRYKKFTTKNQGIRVLAMGFLFDFTNGADNIVIQKVERAIKEDWFQKAIRDRDVDLFLIIGHVDIHSTEYEAIFKAIRAQQWDKPIQFFGGHTHIRDYAKYDSKAYALESGRYLETIGFMSINGLSAGGKKTMDIASSKLRSYFPSKLISSRMVTSGPKFSRRYIDNNLYSFHHHTRLNSSTFPTQHGLNVSKSIQTARKSLKLDKTFGCAPQAYWTNRAPFPSDDSVFSLLKERIFPDKVAESERQDIPRLVLSNTGAIRFDIFKGPFTVDSMYTVSPFTSGFRYVQDVPFKIAKRLLQILNQEVPQLWSVELAGELKSVAPVNGDILSSVEEIANDKSLHAGLGVDSGMQHPLMGLKKDDGEDDDELTPGYTTHDAAGSDGDDTVHSSIKFYKVPNCIESRLAFPEDEKEEPENVDVVYNEFLEKYVLLVLKFLGSGVDKEATESYMEGKTMTEVLGEWVQENWPCEEEHEL